MNKELNRKYYLNRKEKHNAYSAEYYIKNKERVDAYKKEWYKKRKAQKLADNKK